MKRFLIALQFLTAVPFSINGKIEKADFGRSLVYFPVVGFLLGILLAGVAFISGPFPPMVRSILILTVWVIITGGLHLDGFADTCDGFYGRRPREEVLKIMRDSRIGTMGAAGLVVLLIFKFAVLSSIMQEDLWKVLIMAAVFARWSQALACVTSGYAREDGKAKYFIEYARVTDVLASGLFTLVLFRLLLGAKGALLFVLLSAVVFLFIKYIKARIGGMTGDTIGAINEVAETAALLFSLISLGYKI